MKRCLAFVAALVCRTSTGFHIGSLISHNISPFVNGECRTASQQPSKRLGVPLFSQSDGDVAKPSESEGDKNDFWIKQKALAVSITEKGDEAAKKEQMDKFASRRLGLVSDTLFFSSLIFSAMWAFSPTPFTSLSYAFGALLGTAYSYGLGKYVETLGGSAEDTDATQGAGVGQARFAFLIALFIIVGRFRAQGMQEIPAIAGFFTYQLASLNQGLRQYDD